MSVGLPGFVDTDSVLRPGKRAKQPQPRTTSAVELLTALEYGTRKEDKALTARLLSDFGLSRLPKSRMSTAIESGPGLEAFLLAAARESRPFALMLREVYAFLSAHRSTAEGRASVFRVSGAGARATFKFDLENFPILDRQIREIERAVKVVRLRALDDVMSPIRWRSSKTEQLWDKVSPGWDWDFYDDFHRALSYAGTMLREAEDKHLVRLIVAPIVDRLRALTEPFTWDEFGVSDAYLRNATTHESVPFPELGPPDIHPILDTRLDREHTLQYLAWPVIEDDRVGPTIAPPSVVQFRDGAWAAISGLSTDPSGGSVVSERVLPILLDMAISVDVWEKERPRADSDDWLAKKVGKPLAHITPAEYIGLLEPIAVRYRASLDELLETVHETSALRAGEALIEFLGLPFWKDRWFLYELWTLCHVLELAAERWPLTLEGLQPRSDGVVEWILPKGSARRPVARIGAKGELECWTQLKTKHPATGKGLEPDIRITRDGGRPDVFIVENKDRRKPRKQEMEEILQRYVSGTSARCVYMINYEDFTKPTHLLSLSAPGRDVLVASHFRPREVPMEFKTKLLGILDDEFVEKVTVPEDTVAKVTVPEDTANDRGYHTELTVPARAIQIEVELEWQRSPDDLDLHVWIARTDGVHHIGYAERGSLDAPPYAQLAQDVRTVPGRETVTIRTDQLKWATIAVHRYSPGPFAMAGANVRIGGIADGIGELSLSSNAPGAWWHVGKIDGDDITLSWLDTLSEEPPPIDLTALIETPRPRRRLLPE